MDFMKLINSVMGWGEFAGDVGQLGAPVLEQLGYKDTARSIQDLEAYGDMGKAVTGALQDFSAGKSWGEIIGNNAGDLAGGAADLFATQYTNKAMDWLDEKLGGFIPDGMKSVISTAVGEIADFSASSLVNLITGGKTTPEEAAAMTPKQTNEMTLKDKVASLAPEQQQELLTKLLESQQGASLGNAGLPSVAQGKTAGVVM